MSQIFNVLRWKIYAEKVSSNRTLFDVVVSTVWDEFTLKHQTEKQQVTSIKYNWGSCVKTSMDSFEVWNICSKNVVDKLQQQKIFAINLENPDERNSKMPVHHLSNLISKRSRSFDKNVKSIFIRTCYSQNRRQKAFNRGALQFCGGLCVCAWGRDIIKLT